MMVKPVGARPGGPQIPRNTPPPPLPAGQAPQQQQQQPDPAVLAAAWAAYYAQNPGATTSQAPQPAAQPGPYQNYGYGAGVAMGGANPAPHSAGGYPQHSPMGAGPGPQAYAPQHQAPIYGQNQPQLTGQTAAYNPQVYGQVQHQQGFNGAQASYGAQGPVHGGASAAAGAHHQQHAGPGPAQGQWQQQHQNQPHQPLNPGGYGGPSSAQGQSHYGGTGIGGGAPTYANVNQPSNTIYSSPAPTSSGFHNQPPHGNHQYPAASPAARPGYAGPPPAGGPPMNRPGVGPRQNNGPPGGGDFPPAKRPRMEPPPHVPNNRGPPPIQRGGFGGPGGQGLLHGNAQAGPSSNYQGGGGGGGSNYHSSPQSDFGGSDRGRGGAIGRGGMRGAPPMRGSPARGGGRGGGPGGVGHHVLDSPRHGLGGRGGPPLPGRGGASDRGAVRGGRGGFVGGPGIATPSPAKYPPGPPSSVGRGGMSSVKPREGRTPARGGSVHTPARGSSKFVVPPSSFKKEKRVISDKDKAAQEEARRKTLTDFRILGMEIKSLGWSWGVIGNDVEEKDGSDDDDVFEDAEAGEDESDAEATPKREEKKAEATESEVQLSKKQKKEKNKRDREAAEASANSTPPEPAVGELSVSAVDSDLPADLQAEIGEGARKKKKKGAAVEVAETEDVKPAVSSNGTAPEAATEVLKEEVKRGEKRKAKMSSPDADDDARQTSKKRANLNSSTSAKDVEAVPAVLSQPANRLRIYFESAIAAEPTPPNALKRKADASADESGVAPAEGAAEEPEEEEAAQEEEEEEEHENGEESVAAVPGAAEEGEAETEGDEVVTKTKIEEVDAPDATDVEAELTVEPAVDSALERAETGEADAVDGEEMQKTAVLDGQDADGDVAMETLETEDLDGEPVEVLDVTPVDDPAVDVVPVAPVENAEEGGAETDAGQQKANAAKAEEAEKIAQALKLSAEATVAAYGARAAARPETSSTAAPGSQAYRRSPSLPPTDAETPIPSSSRISILYDNGTRRMCLDASVVDKIRIFRSKGVVHIFVRLPTDIAKMDDIAQKTEEMKVTEKATRANSEKVAEEAESDVSKDVILPGANEWGIARGLLLEVLDENKGIFSLVTRSALVELWKEADGIVKQAQALPPVHRIDPADEATRSVKMVVYLDAKNRFSEPRWVKTGQLSQWVQSVFGSVDAKPATNPWQGKLEVVDPDAPSSIYSILENWTISSELGALKSRRRFSQSHFASIGNVVQILLQVLKGDKKPVSRSGLANLQGPLATVIEPTAPYAGEQTHATLAVLALVSLAREYAEKAGEESKILDGRISNIVKSLPNQCLFPAVDKLFLDWLSQEGRDGRKK